MTFCKSMLSMYDRILFVFSLEEHTNAGIHLVLFLPRIEISDRISLLIRLKSPSKGLSTKEKVNSFSNITLMAVARLLNVDLTGSIIGITYLLLGYSIENSRTAINSNCFPRK